MKVGLIGTGTVGSGVIRIYQQNGEHLDRQSLEKVQLKTVCDLDFTRCPQDLSAFQRVSDWRDVVSDPEIGTVVELIGGEEPARSAIAQSLQAGKHVVTANKMVLARHGRDLLALASENRVSLLFEAAVAGAIPVIAPLRSSLLPSRIQAVYGIVNGTTNFILSRMHRFHADFPSVLAEAQRLGYAEAYPSSDVDGYDSLYKLCLLAATAFEVQASPGKALLEGISALSPRDIQQAIERNEVIKLVAMARWTGGRLEMRVHPVILEEGHPLATVSDVFNAVHVLGDGCGELTWIGRGAGGVPTASSVWADILALANRTAYRMPAPVAADLLPKEEMVSSFRIRLCVQDHPDVIASASNLFSQYQVEVREAVRAGSGEGAELIFQTGPAREGNKDRLLETLAQQPWLREIASVLRVGLE